MRVLLLHNRYRLPGGEERAVDEIEALLRTHGHTVQKLVRSSDGASNAAAAHRLIRGGENIDAEIQAFGPDVVHAHNLHPLLGWRALASAKRAGARTILHVHNFRLVCAIGIAYRDGHVCHKCHGTNTLPGIRHNCRGNPAESLAYGVGLSRQQPHLLRHTDALVAVSAATVKRLDQFGVLGARPLPNFVSAIAPVSNAASGSHALAAGRLVPEKGFDTAITAARAARIPLVIAGDGPDRARLTRLAEGADVRFVGRVGEDELARWRATAAVTLAPSRWEEPCPYGVLDSLAAGVPVLASNLGGLPELVDNPVGDDEWADRLAEVWRDHELRQGLGEAALERARQNHSPDRYYERLLELYS